MVAVAVPVAPAVSVIWTPTAVVPAVPVGVPDTMPEVLSDRPCGNEPPLVAQAYGGIPPVALSCCE